MQVLPPTPDNVALAALRLRAGGLVALPTETVYGLGASARDVAAVERVFRLKGRPRSHPLIVHIASAAQLSDWGLGGGGRAAVLAEAFWPGPLTLVLPRAPGVPDAVTGGQPTVALRVPAHPVAQALLAAFGDGVAAPSANRFGRISPTTAAHAASEFADEDIVVLDGGPCEVGLESTIVDLTGSAPRLLRPGGVAVAEVEGALGERVELPRGVRADLPRVPGSLRSHYAPDAPVTLLGRDELDARALASPEVGVLARHAAPTGFRGRWAQLPDDPRAYARGLYAALRLLDEAAPREILVESVPSAPAWLAVGDRLQRASAPRSGGQPLRRSA